MSCDIEKKDWKNTKEWMIGDIVIHEADAKNHDMLMMVVKKRKSRNSMEIIFVTKYLNPHNTMPHHLKRDAKGQIPRQYTREYENTIEFLHDPADFGIDIKTKHGGLL